MNINERIALKLGYEIGDFLLPIINALPDTHKLKCRFNYKSPDGIGLSVLPNWSGDKNLWVEGSEVVEYLREKNIEWTFTVGLLGVNPCLVSADGLSDMYDLIMQLPHLPASDYAQAFLDVTGG